MTLSGWIGPALAKIRLHAIQIRPTTIAKRRRWYAPILIEAGNLYLRWLEAGVMGLRDRAWKAREIALYRQIYGVECEVDRRGWLILPRWPGVVMSDFMSDVRLSPSDRLSALELAARALHALPSHGDATLRNVIHDPATRQAHWFDFDTDHEPSIPAIDRRADDLRAMLYSSIERMADVPVLDVFRAIRSGYPDPEPWERLRDRLKHGPIHSSPFHLAQARPPVERREVLERLLGTLRRRPISR